MGNCGCMYDSVTANGFRHVAWMGADNSSMQFIPAYIAMSVA